MKKTLFLMLIAILSSSLYAYIDSDMDGVADGIDRCPNTPFSDLVDINGCTKKSLISPHHFDVVAGVNYSDSDYHTLNKTTTYSSTLQVDYYYKNFSLQASTTYFSTDGSGYSETGLYDSFIGASYQFKPAQNLSLRLGAGVLLPTYDSSLNNNNTDYSATANLSYSLESINIFGGYTYTMINDDDVYLVDVSNNVTTVNYQDTNSYNIGLGYYMTDRLYVSGSYNVSNSIYKGVEDIKTASTYLYYSIDEHWFSTFSYAYGLSDTASKNYASLRLGYFF